MRHNSWTSLLSRRHLIKSFFTSIPLLGVLTPLSTLLSACQNSESKEGDSPNLPIILGSLEDFPPGNHPLRLYRVLLKHELRGPNAEFSAVSMVCTHMTCLLKLSPKAAFTCPCHGSRFSAEGDVLSGPAKKALPWFELSVNDKGEILLHREKVVSAEWRLKLEAAA